MRARSLLLLAALGLPGCGGDGDAMPFAAPPPPKVTVRNAVQETITPTMEFTGSTEPSATQNVVARVTGFLAEVHFTAGDDVETDDLLFVIEKGPFEARLSSAEAELTAKTASAELAGVTLDRITKAFERQGASELEVRQATAEKNAADAAVDAATAAVELATIDLGYTDVKAQVSGRISREFISVGNLVGAGDSVLLTTIVDNDPMYMYFTVDERTIVQFLRERTGTGGERRPKAGQLLFSDGVVYGHEGVVDFAENELRDGRVQIRATFPNPDNVLVGGLFVRIRIPLEPEEAVLIPETLILRDIAGPHVLVVNDKSVVERRDVELGRLLEDNRRQILSGLDTSARVIADNLLRCRPGAPVEITEPEA